VPPKPDETKDSDKPPAGKELPKKAPAPKEDAEQDPATNPNAVDAAPDSDPDKPASQKGDDASDAATDDANAAGQPPVPGDDQGVSQKGENPSSDDDGSKPDFGKSDDSVDSGNDQKPESGKTNPDGSKPEDLPAAHEGDPCPSCGNGKLTKAQADEFNTEEQALASGDETETQVADDADGGHYPGDDSSGDQKDDGSTDDSGSPDQTDSAGESDDDPDKDGKPKPWPSKKNSPPPDKSKQVVKSTLTPEGVSSMAPRPMMKVVAEQQDQIRKLEAQNAWLYSAVNRLATVAGLKQVTADENNPADPIPSPGAEAPYSTLEQERQPGARADVAAIGGVPGETDVAADSTTTVDAIGGINADTPYNVSEDVTKPTEGTDGHRPLDEVRTRPRVEFGNPLKPDAAFPLQGEWAGKATVGSASRGFAALRLARLRIEAGIEQGEDVVIAQRIEADASISDGLLAYEAETLTKTISAGARRTTAAAQPQRRQAAATRAVPSVAASAPAPTLGSTTGAAVSADEMLFE
jgi:hypothetical protein